MKLALLAYAFALIGLLILDALWLSLMMPLLYRKHLAHLLASTPVWWAAVLFYVLYAFGIYFLVLRPALTQQQDLLTTFACGVVLGLIAYGTYDLTNQATLRNWPAILSFIDIVWGAVMTGIVSLFSYWLARICFNAWK